MTESVPPIEGTDPVLGSTKWRVQAHGIHLSRLLYLSEEEFKFLKVLRGNFLKKVLGFFEKPPKTRVVAEEQLITGPTRGDLQSRIDNHTLCYEPTNMVTTRDALFWGWRRVNEYCRDFLTKEDNGESKEAYALMHS